MEAAFFDLDKTVIAKASLMAFGKAFYREGLISRRNLARGLWTQVIYVRLGASAKKLAQIRRTVLEITQGWEQARVREIVAEGLVSVIDPITYPDAVGLIEAHRSASRRIYLVSAAPVEIVEPLARHLGVDEAIASLALVDRDGRYTGEMECYAYGPAKAALIREIADRDGVDLARSWAYSDSATDLPMLEVVGHPVAVNPDRALRRIAQLRDWEILRFSMVTKSPIEHEVIAVADRRPSEGASPGLPISVTVDTSDGMGTSSQEEAFVGKARLALAAGTLGALAASGGGALWWRHRKGERQPA